MKKQKRVLLMMAMALSVLLTSCGGLLKKDIGPDLGSPDPAEKPAKGTFDAKVNGKSFTPMSDGVEFEAEEGEDKSFTTIGISAMDRNYNAFSFIVVAHESMSDLKGKDIDLADENVSAIYQSFTGSLTSLKWYGATKGSIRFSQITNKQLVGTFSFSAETDSGDKVEITDGKFSIYY